MLFFWKWPVKEAIGGDSGGRIKVVPEDWLPLFSLHNLKLWVEIFLVTFFASSLWALYPTRGRVELQLNSWQYGSLLGFLGLGACLSAFLSERIMQPHRTQASLAGAYLVYAAGVLILGFSPHYPGMCVAMFLAGIG
ncbi:MAG: MFS transporter, partial [Bdellovibrio sp.]